jgi:hypothetical protein
MRIMPLGGSAARNVPPRVGYLHITAADPDYGQSNTLILVGRSAGRTRS